MEIEVHLSLSDGEEVVELEVRQGSSLQSALDTLASSHSSDLRRVIGDDGRNVIITVNDGPVQLTESVELKEGDKIRVVPIVAGG